MLFHYVVELLVNKVSDRCDVFRNKVRRFGATILEEFKYL